MLDLGFSEIIRNVALQSNGRIVLTGKTTNNEDMYTVRLIGGPPPSVSIVSPTTAISTTATSTFLALAGTAADAAGCAHAHLDRLTAASQERPQARPRGLPTSRWPPAPTAVTVTATNANGVIRPMRSSSRSASSRTSSRRARRARSSTSTSSSPIRRRRRPTSRSRTSSRTGRRCRRRSRWRRSHDAPSRLTRSSASRTRRYRPSSDPPTPSHSSSSGRCSGTSTYYGGHTGNAVDAPATQWLLRRGQPGLLRHVRAAGQRQRRRRRRRR